MEMLACANFLEQRSSQVARCHERFFIMPLSQELEEQTVQVIRKTLINLPQGGAELGTTLRKLDSFYTSYKRDGSVYLTLMDTQSESVVGGVGVVSFAGLDPSEGIGEIRELAVDPAYRQQGLGLKLLQAAFDMAMSFQYKRLYLETTEHMNQAEALFLRFGFRPVSLQQKDQRRRNEPLIRQAGRPAFYVWEDENRPASLLSTP